jgi:GNAT superfamily N-acetyltransferase
MQADALTVRRAAPSEHGDLARLMTQLGAAHGGRGDLAAARVRLSLLLGAEYEPWVAVEGDAILAYALTMDCGDHVFIRQFAVDEAARGRGVGRALFAGLEDAYGGPQFRLDVMFGRDDARAFWESLGFGARAVNMRREAP